MSVRPASRKQSSKLSTASHASSVAPNVASSRHSRKSYADVASTAERFERASVVEAVDPAKVACMTARDANIRSRLITATWHGSLLDFGAGKNLSCECESDSIDAAAPSLTAAEVQWRPSSTADTVEFFGISGFVDGKSDVHQADLRHIRLHGVELVSGSASKNLEIPVAFSFPGVKGSHYNGYSERRGAVMHAGVAQPSVLLEKADILDSAFANSFPGLTSDNVNSSMILPVPDSDSTMVHKDHPIINMIAAADIEQAAERSPILTASPAVAGMYYLIDTAAVNRSLEVLKAEVVDMLPDVNMTDFKIGLHRADGEVWGSSLGVPHAGTDAAKDAVMQAVHTVSATFRVTFELPAVA